MGQWDYNLFLDLYAERDRALYRVERCHTSTTAVMLLKKVVAGS